MLPRNFRCPARKLLGSHDGEGVRWDDADLDRVGALVFDQLCEIQELRGVGEGSCNPFAILHESCSGRIGLEMQAQKRIRLDAKTRRNRQKTGDYGESL